MDEAPESIARPTVPTNEQLDEMTLEQLDELEEEAAKTSVAVANYSMQVSLRLRKIHDGKVRKHVALAKSKELLDKKKDQLIRILADDLKRTTIFLRYSSIMSDFVPLPALFMGFDLTFFLLFKAHLTN
jgi:hypothetical protein